MSFRISRSILILAVALTAARPAFAGPPLLCHPYDIASARSLPWGGGGWMETRPDYDVSHLAADTLALLTPSTPVVVRMETLRRAAIYASRDGGIAAQLLYRLTARIRAADTNHQPDALAWLDAAYLIEALRQIGYLGGSAQFRDTATRMADLVKDLDGRSMIQKATILRPGDPGVEFAAALIAADKDRALYLEHAKKARAGAASDALVARNISMVQ
jgi:hypothetical protein